MMNCCRSSSSSISNPRLRGVEGEDGICFGGSELHIWYLVGYAKLFTAEAEAAKVGRLFNGK